jgi:hypothetical protein
MRTGLVLLLLIASAEAAASNGKGATNLTVVGVNNANERIDLNVTCR